MSTQTLEPRRTKASLSGELSDFLIELSAAFQKYAMYPAGHPALGPAANAVFTRLSALLASHGAVSIGVARDQLIIEGVATDASHPLLRALADRLHRHELGAISFAEGVAPTEIAEVLALLSTDPERSGRPIGREPEEVLKGRPRVRLHPVRYESLKLRERSGAGGRRDASVHLWVGLAQAALAAKQEADRNRTEYDPADVARAIDERSDEQAYDQVVIGYMVQIVRDLKSADPLEQNELRERFSSLISKLQPETLRRLLRMGGDLRQRRAFLDDASQGVAADAVLELVKAAAAEEQSDISRWMMRLLSKMARHAGTEGDTARYRADEALRDQVRQLLSGWQLENPNPTEYEQALSRMASGAPVARMSAGSAREPEAERIFRMGLETAEATEPMHRALDALVDRGDVGAILAELDVAPPGPDGINPAVVHCWERLAEPAVVRRLVAAEDPDFEALDRILTRAGIEATDALLDRLASSESLSLRRKTFDRLVALGPGILPAAVQRIEQPESLPWYVLRNVLALLTAFEGLPGGFSASQLRAHPNPQVRYEALKLCLRDPELRDGTILSALSDDSGRIVALGVAATEEGAPVQAEARLAEFALDPAEDAEIRLPAIRALGEIGTDTARETLLTLCAPRRRLVRFELPDATAEACAALRAAARGWPDDPRVAEIVALARSSADPDWREAST